MADRYDVHPHHVLRAVLEDRVATDVLSAIDVDPAQVQVTLAHHWLDAADTIEVEEIETVGVDVTMLLAALNPADGTRPQWGGRHLTQAARDVLVRSLGVCGAMRQRRTTSGHVLLALLACKDPIVVRTFATHGIGPQESRRLRGLVEQWGRRAT
jgi:hypothetical protein